MNRLRRLWRTLHETVDLAREVPGEIMLGIEARAELAKLHATGWPNVEELAMAWATASRDEGEALERLRRLFVDVPELRWRCDNPETCACSVAGALRLLNRKGLA